MILPVHADVVISEFHAAPNESAVDWNTNGEPRLGTGPHWQEPDFDDTGWPSGLAPLGVGTGTTTNVAALMQNKTPSLYVRKTFSLTAQQAAAFGDLILRVAYDDGFIAFINGREAARANMGPARQFAPAQMTTYRAENVAAGTPVPYNLGPLDTWLVPGANVLAVQLHNRDLTSNCRIDPTLESVINPVIATLVTVDFNTGNGATATHRNVGGSITSQTSGTPPAGSWLQLAAPPATSALWQDFTVTAKASATDGLGGGGAQRWDFSQTGPDQTAAVFGAPVTYTPFLSPADLAVSDLQKLSVTFRYRVSSGAGFGMRMDAGPGGAALSGFPALTEIGDSGEAPPLSFSTNANGSRRRQVDAAGTQFNVLSNPTTLTTLVNGPAMRGGSTLLTRAEFNLTEDATPGAGADGSTGAIKFFVSRAPVTWDYFGFYFSDLTVLSLPAGALTVAQLGEVQLAFDWKLGAGESFRVYLEPETGGYADRQDFGLITGTGSYEAFRQNLDAGSNTAAFLVAINAGGTRDFRLVFRRDTAMPVQSPLWVDNVGFSSGWRTWSANLGTDSNPATHAAFVSALKSGGLTSFVPAFDKLSPAPAAPASSHLIIDDFKVLFNGAPGAVPQTFVGPSQSWKYWVGRAEPSGGLTDPAYFADATFGGDFSDWIELHNDGAAPADISNWGLTDDPDEPHKWQFPPGTTLPPGGYLMVLADAPAAPVAGAAFLHANFSLTADGEYLGLFDAAGTARHVFDPYPKNFPFHSYGRDPEGSGGYGYLRRATPGKANFGTLTADYVRTPDFSVPGGFYNTSQTVTLTTSTPGAEIRYTTDGSDPGPASALYSSPLVLNQVSAGNGHCLRARAFKAGLIPSGIKTHTYLISQSASLQTGPALVITGDPGRALFKPYGITAIQGGSWTGGPWAAAGPNDYNNALADINNATSTTLGLPLTGGPWERPVTVEFHYPDGRDGFREDVALRISGSAFTRPRYVLNTILNAPWSLTSSAEKPGFNLFFDANYGKSALDFPLFPGNYPVTNFEQFRLRAGHNDLRDPFVKDEFMRRSSIAMGQPGSLGLIAPLYVNGKFRGIYNLTERLREPFMQAHFNSSAKWDVRQVTEVANGDTAAFTDYIARLDAYYADSSNQAKYNAVLDVLDLTNYIDYALMNIWGGTGDWPHNNFVCSRERSATGKWRWFVWDAEGAFGGFSKHLGYNVLTRDLLSNPTAAGREICRTYSRLIGNREFRQMFADRINRHFCNGGALTDAKLRARKDGVIAEYQPLFTYTGGGAVSQTWFNNWVQDGAPDRRDVLFRSHVATYNEGSPAAPVMQEWGYQFPDQNVWPAVDGHGTWNAPLPPQFNQHGGDVPGNFSLTISHTEIDNSIARDNPYKISANQSPAGRVIYYSTTGADPRLTGGGINPAAAIYTGAIPLTQPIVTVKSRIYNTANQEWSPLTEAEFRVGLVPPATANLAVAEIMYNPADATATEETLGFTDKDLFEFIRLQNIGAAPLRLYEAKFTLGITFDFNAGAIRTLAPGQSVLLVKHLAAFQARYGHSFDGIIAGEFGGNLGNSGDRLRLEDAAQPVAAAIRDFTYADSAPWPETPDGSGASLLLINPSGNPDHNNPANWTASALPGGLFTLGQEQNYERWRSLSFAPGAAADNLISGMDADPDGDGVRNLVEFALGALPQDPDSSQLPTGRVEEINGSRHLCIEYRTPNHHAGVAIQPQVSGDLASWTQGVTLFSATPHPDGSTTFVYRDNTPFSASQRRFIRLFISTTQ